MVRLWIYLFLYFTLVLSVSYFIFLEEEVPLFFVILAFRAD